MFCQLSITLISKKEWMELLLLALLSLHVIITHTNTALLKTCPYTSVFVFFGFE